MLVIGHRGAGAYAPHNSRQSFAQAIAQGADMIETDIRVTRDNIPVLHHDRDTLWGPVDELAWKELCRYPLENGEYILPLEEMLLLFGHKIRFNLEIKPLNLEKIAAITHVLNKFSLSDPLISSFSQEIAVEFSGYYPTALLIEKAQSPEEILAALEKCHATALNIYFPLLEEKLAREIQNHGYQIIVWTDFPSEIWNPLPLYKKALELSCHGFITGKPALLVQYLQLLNLQF
ncbi:MAG: glycerophosphodiester phosphodiesterase [Clostridia bacterium]|nr:glycerophosphodiester phosphodiesterase [Clostridia bacterium]